MEGTFIDGGNNDWGTQGEVPTFNYAMRLGPGDAPGTDRVFLEETCLVSRDPLPFSVLKRRLTRRAEALGVRIGKVHDEEWSYIPVGGPLPTPDNTLLAFGAAANMVHPATGYSVTRSLVEADRYAETVARALRDLPDGQPIGPAARQVWSQLWDDQRRAQRSFQLFGMDLLADLDVRLLSEFFVTFFRLPPRMWKGFLASGLSAGELVLFALATFFHATWGIRGALTAHLVRSPTTPYVVDRFAAAFRGDRGDGPQ